MMPDPLALGFWLSAAAALASGVVAAAVRARQAWAARQYDEACLLAGAGLLVFALMLLAGLLAVSRGGTAP